MADVNTKLLAAIEYLEGKISSLELQHGKDGKDGVDGKQGLQGIAGKDGKDGRDGVDGTDGVDGAAGSDGVSVVDAEVDFDGRLRFTLSDGNIIDAGDIKVDGTGNTYYVGGGKSGGDEVGVASLNTDSWGRGKTLQDRSLLHGMFTFDVPNDKWYEMNNNLELSNFNLAQSVDGKLVLSSGVQNEKIGLRSFRYPRYEPNRGHLYSTSAFFPNPTALAERSMGIFTSESGVGFRVRNGVLYGFVRTTVGGVVSDQEVELNLPKGFDLAKGHVYDIQFQWRGVGNYFFFVDLKPVGHFDFLGKLDELSSFNPALPAAFECINQGDAVTLNVGCVDITSEGGTADGLSYGSLGITTESGSVSVTGFNVPILAVRNKEIINGQLNTRDMLALLATAYSDNKSVFRVWATRDETAITVNDQAWLPFRDGHIEYIEYDNPNVGTPMTFDTTKADLIFSARIDQDSSYSTSALFEGRADIYQSPKDIFIFTIHRETGQGAVVGVTYEFAEAI